MRKVLDNLKRCPYTTCGHQPVLTGYETDTPEAIFQVECEHCGATGPICDTEDAAIQEWNAIERHEPKKQEPLDADKILKEFRKTMNLAFDTFARKIGSDVRICPICGHEAKVLHLVLTHEWYDAHASGAKDIEYRAMSPHWKRLIGDRKLTLTHVRYSRGYSSTTMIRPILSISLGNCPIEGWNDLVYRIYHPPYKPRACTSCGETTRAFAKKSGLCCACEWKKQTDERAAAGGRA
jgi:hypothetical protein